MKKRFIIIGISLGLLALNYFGWLSWFKGGVGRVFGWRSKLYPSLVGNQIDEKSIEKRLVECQTEIVELKEENWQSRRLLGAKIKPETKFELAKIVAVGDQKMQISLEKPNVINAFASVVSGPILVGKVNEVFGKAAEVKLLVSSQTKLPVKIWPDQNVSEADFQPLGEGILTSDGQNLYVEEVLDSQEISVDNWVGAVVESGDIFWIGKIEEVFPSEDKIFQQAKVNWNLDLSKIVSVEVIK